jgi:hypothetical protein
LDVVVTAVEEPDQPSSPDALMVFMAISSTAKVSYSHFATVENDPDWQARQTLFSQAMDEKR